MLSLRAATHSIACIIFAGLHPHGCRQGREWAHFIGRDSGWLHASKAMLDTLLFQLNSQPGMHSEGHTVIGDDECCGLGPQMT